MQRDVFFIARSDAAAVADEIVELAARRLPAFYHADPLRDIQVLSPIYKGPIGILELNRRLRERLNPDGAPACRGRLRLGDKLIQTRNDHLTGLVNGQVAELLEDRPGSEPGEGELVLDVDGDRVAVPYERAGSLVHAYAISVHKSQGSEIPVVVVPVHRSHAIMLTRNLLYTAVSRASRALVLVGQREAIAARRPSRGRRRTILAAPRAARRPAANRRVRPWRARRCRPRSPAAGDRLQPGVPARRPGGVLERRRLAEARRPIVSLRACRMPPRRAPPISGRLRAGPRRGGSSARPVAVIFQPPAAPALGSTRPCACSSPSAWVTRSLRRCHGPPHQGGDLAGGDGLSLMLVLGISQRAQHGPMLTGHAPNASGPFGWRAHRDAGGGHAARSAGQRLDGAVGHGGRFAASAASCSNASTRTSAPSGHPPRADRHSRISSGPSAHRPGAYDKAAASRSSRCATRERHRLVACGIADGQRWRDPMPARKSEARP